MEPDLESRIKALEDENVALKAGHEVNRNRIKQNRSRFQVLLSLAAFMAVAIGGPIASIKWTNSTKEFELTRNMSPEFTIIGAVIAASLFAGDKPKELLKLLIQSNKK